MAAQDVPTVTAIDASQVAQETDRLARAFRGYEQTAAPSPAVSVIDAGLPGIAGKIDEQEELAARTLDGSVSRGALAAVEASWTGLKLELPGWLRDVTARLRRVGDALEELDQVSVQWEATEAALRADTAPEALIASVVRLRERILEVRGRVAERRAALLTLQTALAEQDARVEDGLGAVQAARASLVGRVFERDQQPLWDWEVYQPASGLFAGQIRGAVVAQRDTLIAIARQHPGAPVFHVVLLLGLVLLLHSARSRVRRRSEAEQGLGRVAEVFELPYSIALLLALAASPWIYSYVPPVLGQLLWAIALIPAVRMLRHFSDKAFYPLLNALVVFYLLDRVRELVAVLPLLSRVIFLVEMLGAAALIGWMLRPSRLQHIPAYTSHGLLYTLGLACRLALFVMLSAAAAEVMGYSRLADLVGSAVLDSAYIGIILYAAVRIFDSLMTFALRVPPLGLLGMVRHSRYEVRRRIHRTAAVLAAVWWVYITLGLFEVRPQILAVLGGMLTADLTMGTVSLSLADVLAFAVTVWLSFVLSRFVRFALEEDVYPRLQLPRGIPYAISTLARYSVLAFGFFLAVAATGVELNRFAILAGAFGVGIGFGLQDVVNNFVSGLILLTERPVQVGDTIESEGLLGEVKRIGIRSSTVRTWSGAELIVPNAQLISERVTNWTLSDQLRRLELPVGVAYGSDVEAVIALLEGVGEAHDDVIGDPAVIALFRGFGNSSLDFELRAWTDVPSRYAQIQSELNVGINRALAQAGIEIPFPQRDLHLRSVDREVGALLGDSGGRDEGS